MEVEEVQRDLQEEPKKKFWSMDIITPILMVITAIGILVTTIVYEQAFWKVVPLFVSLVVALLNSKVNRKGLLLGSLNSLFYAAVYFTYKLYASVGYAVLVSFPVQLAAFIRWSKRKSGNSTVFGRLSNRTRLLLVAGFVVCWVALYLILSQLGSGYLILDNTVSLVGILASVLAIFAVIEYTWLTWISSFVSMIMYMVMIGDNPEQITYLIYSVYALICITLSVINSTKLYRKQKAERENDAIGVENS